MENQYLNERPLTYNDIQPVAVNDVVRLCIICRNYIRNVDYMICPECRDAILFAKELRKAAVKNV